MLFNSEDEMQKWFENALEHHGGLTGIVDTPTETRENPNDIIEQKFRKSLDSCMKSFDDIQKISARENIAFERDSVLEPDALFYCPHTERIVIVELKNSAETSRETGTELSAYTAEIRNHLPFIAEGDIVNIIISTEWPDLLKRHVLQDIFWRDRKLICLEPYKAGKEIRLRTKQYRDLKVSVDLSLFGHNISGFQLCLYDNSVYGKDVNHNHNGLLHNLNQIKSAMVAVSAKGNTLGSHGFAFLWRDVANALCPYSIVICNVNPYSLLDRSLPDSNLSEIQNRLVNLVQQQEPTGHGESFMEISREATSFVEFFCNPCIEGFHNWQELENMMMGRAEYVSFVSWGVIEDLFFDYLREKNQSGDVVDTDSPVFGAEFIGDLIKVGDLD